MSALRCADVAELADALDSGSSGHYARAGSSPVIRSNAENGSIEGYCRFFYFHIVYFIQKKISIYAKKQCFIRVKYNGNRKK